MSSKDFKLSDEDSHILSVLKEDGYCVKNVNRNSDVWVFWFSDLMAFNLTDQSFHSLCVWKDELAFAERYSLPTKVSPLSSLLSPSLSKTVQERFLTHTAHSMLLEEGKPVQPEAKDV